MNHDSAQQFLDTDTRELESGPCYRPAYLGSRPKPESLALWVWRGLGPRDSMKQMRNEWPDLPLFELPTTLDG